MSKEQPNIDKAMEYLGQPNRRQHYENLATIATLTARVEELERLNADERYEAGMYQSLYEVAKARTGELEKALRAAEMKLRGIVAYAKGNAKAAKIADEEKTWEAHADVVERVCKNIRAAALGEARSAGKSQ